LKIVFTDQHRRENKCSVHLDEQVMSDQMQRLGEDMRATLEKDQEAAYREVLGKLPSDRQIKRHAHIQTLKPSKGAEVYVLMFKNRRICAFTAPIPRTVKFHYILRWYFKALTK